MCGGGGGGGVVRSGPNVPLTKRNSDLSFPGVVIAT